LPSSATTRQRG